MNHQLVNKYVLGKVEAICNKHSTKIVFMDFENRVIKLLGEKEDKENAINEILKEMGWKRRE